MDDDSNTQRNKRVIYHATVLLNFQDPAGPPNPLNHGYNISNGLCVPIMYTKPPLPDELAQSMTLSLNITDSGGNESDSDESGTSSDEDIDDGLDI